MKVVRRCAGVDTDLDLRVGAADTVGDLIVALDLDTARAVLIDDRLLTSDLPLAMVSIRPGAVIAPIDPDDLGPRPRPVVAALVPITGLAAGTVFEVREGITALLPAPRPVTRAVVNGPSIEVTADSTVVVRPGGAAVSIDGQATQGDAVLPLDAILAVDDQLYRVVPPISTARPGLGPGIEAVLHQRAPRRILGEEPTPLVPGMLQPDRERRGRKRRNDHTREVVLMAREYLLALAIARRNEIARRREATPDPAELAERARLLDGSVWQRRREHRDLLEMSVGYGEGVWNALDPASVTDEPELLAQLKAARQLRPVPIVVDPQWDGPIAIMGSRERALAVARWMVVQACVSCGPADLSVHLATDGARAGDWDWLKWLDHLHDPDGAPRVAIDDDATRSLLLDHARDAHADAARLRLSTVGVGATGMAQRLVIIDRAAPLAPELAATLNSPGTNVIVLPDGVSTVSVACPTVVSVADRVAVTARLSSEIAGLPTGITVELATSIARDLAALIDPERSDRSTLVGPSFGALLAPDGDRRDMADLLGRRWVAGHGPMPIGADLAGQLVHRPVGVSATDADTFAACLISALTERPDRSRLVVIASRRHPIARAAQLCTVVDAAEEPAVRRSLRSILTEIRERTTGRPGPDVIVAVEDATTLCRRNPLLAPHLALIAAEGPAVGIDVVIGGNLELLDPRVAGHVARRLRTAGAGEAITPSADITSLVPIRLDLAATDTQAQPFGLLSDRRATALAIAPLASIVEEAARRLELPVARGPIPEELPSRVVLRDLPAGAAGLADDIEHQELTPWSWDRSGSLLVVAAAGRDGRNSLEVLTRAAMCDGVEVMLAARQGSPLHALTDCHVLTSDLFATTSLLGDIDAEIDQRLKAIASGHPPDDPGIVVVIDDIAALSTRLHEADDHEVIDGIARIALDGPAAGVVMLATAPDIHAMPARIVAAFPQRLVLAIDDAVDATLLGVRLGEVMELPAMRAVDPSTGLNIQLAEP
ncbi:MAG: hypothetical protein AB7V43_05675 [Acidimicrobiia bacterium]